MFLRWMPVTTGVLAAFLFSGGGASIAQQSVPPVQATVIPRVSLANVVRTLPEYVQAATQAAYLGAIESATIAERDEAIPKLVQWFENDQANVRGLALLSLSLLYIPSDSRPERPYSTPLPVKYVPAVAAHLRDPDPSVRRVAFLALQPVEYSGVGMEELVKLILPMLREPDAVTEYPDPFFVQSDKEMLAGMTPEQQAQFKAQPHKIMKLPAEGAGLLAILALPTRQPSNTVDDAMIAFLDREDQTKSTLGDCLHTLALSSASERVNDEVLRRVFETKAMTIFLLQFVADMRLTASQLTKQKKRLVALSNDESAHPSLRMSARDVAACWNGARNGRCRPSDKDSSEQLDTR